jgi:hypothetical protein
MLEFTDLKLDCWLEVSLHPEGPATGQLDQDSVVFLGPRANAELVPKFHVALHVSHAALPMETVKILPCTNVTLTLGWITLFMGDMGEGGLHREDKATVKQRN